MLTEDQILKLKTFCNENIFHIHEMLLVYNTPAKLLHYRTNDSGGYELITRLDTTIAFIMNGYVIETQWYFNPNGWLNEICRIDINLEIKMIIFEYIRMDGSKDRSYSFIK